jgi:hypothetical protein
MDGVEVQWGPPGATDHRGLALLLDLDQVATDNVWAFR